MAVANTTALDLLGKFVSFEYVRELPLTEQSSITFREKILGKIESVVLSVNSEPEIAVEGGDFYCLSDLVDFLVIPDK